MSIDQFMADLAEIAGTNRSVNISWRGYHAIERRFSVSLYFDNPDAELGCDLHSGDGPTVKAAIADAIQGVKAAKVAADLDSLMASDADLIGGEA